MSETVYMQQHLHGVLVQRHWYSCREQRGCHLPAQLHILLDPHACPVPSLQSLSRQSVYAIRPCKNVVWWSLLPCAGLQRIYCSSLSVFNAQPKGRLLADPCLQMLEAQSLFCVDVSCLLLSCLGDSGVVLPVEGLHLHILVVTCCCTQAVCIYGICGSSRLSAELCTTLVMMSSRYASGTRPTGHGFLYLMQRHRSMLI